MAQRKWRLKRSSGEGSSGTAVALFGILVISIVIGVGVWFVQFNT